MTTKKIEPRKEIDEFGNERWYDKKGNLIHAKYSDGDEYWFDKKGNKITEEEFNKIWEKK